MGIKFGIGFVLMNKFFPIVLALLFFSCDKRIVYPENAYGCTDETACNFNPNANVFDNSCYYAEDWEDECGVCDLIPSNDCAQDVCGVWGGDGTTCSPSIKGYVYDDSGNPVQNAYIFPTYQLNPIDRPSTSIDFHLDSEMLVNFWIENLCGVIISNLINNQLYSAGVHSISWEAVNDDGLRLLDGVYNVFFQANDETVNQKIILLSHTSSEDSIYYSDCTSDDGSLSCEYLVMTDSNGYFEFSQDCLPLGEISLGSDEFGNNLGLQIINKLKLFADDGQKYGFTDFFEVDEYSGADVNIILNNE